MQIESMNDKGQQCMATECLMQNCCFVSEYRPPFKKLQAKMHRGSSSAILSNNHK